jgi:hypothetical protein
LAAGEEMKFTWGDDARISDSAPPPLRPGEIVAVVGMRDIQEQKQATQLGVPVGTTLYLIEYSDGSSAEIPGDLLEPNVGNPV